MTKGWSLLGNDNQVKCDMSGSNHNWACLTSSLADYERSLS